MGIGMSGPYLMQNVRCNDWRMKYVHAIQNWSQYRFIGYDSYRIEELWEGGAVKTPFKTEKEARQRELDIAHVRGWQIKQGK